MKGVSWREDKGLLEKEKVQELEAKWAPPHNSDAWKAELFPVLCTKRCDYVMSGTSFKVTEWWHIGNKYVYPQAQMLQGRGVGLSDPPHPCS